jgi:hypothetical protein
MKLFNFTLIALGIMIIMYLAGVGNTNSSLILNSVLLKNTTQISASSALPETTDISGFISFNNWWVAIGILLAGAFFGSMFKITIGGYQVTPSLDVIYSAFAGGLYTLFITDIISLLTYVGSITDYSGWVFWVIASILIPFAVMYSFSLIEFLKGTD